MILPEKILTDEEREELIKEIMATETIPAVDPKDPDKKHYHANKYGECPEGEKIYVKTVVEDWVNADWKHVPAKLIHKIRNFGRNTEKSFDSIDEHIFILMLVSCGILSIVNNQLTHKIQIAIGAIVTYIMTVSIITRIKNRKTILIEPTEHDKNKLVSSFNIFNQKYEMITEQTCITEKYRRDLNNIQSKTNIGIRTRAAFSTALYKKNNSFIVSCFIAGGSIILSQILMLPHHVLMNTALKGVGDGGFFSISIVLFFTLFPIYTFIEIGGKRFPFAKSKVEKILVTGTQRIHAEIPMYSYLIAGFVTTLLVLEAIKTVF